MTVNVVRVEANGLLFVVVVGPTVQCGESLVPDVWRQLGIHPLQFRGHAVAETGSAYSCRFIHLRFAAAGPSDFSM